MYAVSCLTRAHAPAMEDMKASGGGFEVVVRSLAIAAEQPDFAPLATKCAFYLACACDESPDVRDCLVDMGLARRLGPLIGRLGDAAAAEQVARCLLILVRGSSKAADECRDPGLRLYPTLVGRKAVLASEKDEANAEEAAYCDELLKLLFPDDGGEVTAER